MELSEHPKDKARSPSQGSILRSIRIRIFSCEPAARQHGESTKEVVQTDVQRFGNIPSSKMGVCRLDITTELGIYANNLIANHYNHSSSLSPQTPISSRATASKSTSFPSSSSLSLSSLATFDSFLLKSAHPASSSSCTGKPGLGGT